MACRPYNTGRCLQLRLFNRPNFGVHFRCCPHDYEYTKLLGKKGATPTADAAPCCFIQDSPTLRDLNGLGCLLLLLFYLRKDYRQDAILYLG